MLNVLINTDCPAMLAQDNRLTGRHRYECLQELPRRRTSLARRKMYRIPVKMLLSPDGKIKRLERYGLPPISAFSTPICRSRSMKRTRPLPSDLLQEQFTLISIRPIADIAFRPVLRVVIPGRNTKGRREYDGFDSERVAAFTVSVKRRRRVRQNLGGP
jgi:hypothetical protein